VTDVRATERLLELIAEAAQAIGDDVDASADPDGLVVAMHAAKITEAVDELRRRGDTLVRACDLREVVAVANRAIALRAVAPDLTKNAAIDRIESALGGT
jgi:hypothetical protein